MSINTLLVNTKSGPISGIERETIFGQKFFSYHRIPYAQPPIGDLRFCDPEPVTPWTEILDASQEGPQCWYYGLTKNIVHMDEDSLHLNVFTKQLKPTQPQPVMVFIYGGAFMWGSNSMQSYSPDYFLLKDVVIVTMNYRVGALGFLSISEPACNVPGNAGLKDQTMALRWIQANISHFGGDPNNITLFGVSSGGCSVHFHMVSELSRGLFHKAITMSGCVLNSWSILKMEKMPVRLATALGWTNDGSLENCLTYLRSAKPHDIVAAQMKLASPEEMARMSLHAFGPTVEPYVGKQCLIPQDPLIMMRSAWSRSIPLLIGGTSEEGLVFYRHVKDNPDTLSQITDGMECLLPIELEFSEDKAAEHSRRLRQIYFDADSVSMENVGKYFNFLTDKMFWHGLHRTCLSRLAAAEAPTYLYRFNFDSPTFNWFKNKMVGGSHVRGTCHADDMSYLWKNHMVKSVDRESFEYRTIERMIGIWTEFARSGQPNCAEISEVSWKPIDAKDVPLKCLNISNDVMIIDLPVHDRMKFWDGLYGENQLI